MLLVGVRLLEAVILRQWVKLPICVTTLLNVTSWVILANDLTHWGRVTHICVGNLTIIGSDNGLSPGRRQTIIWTNAGILSIGPLGTNFSEISIGIQTFPFRKMHFIMSSAKWRPFCLGLNVLITRVFVFACTADSTKPSPEPMLTYHQRRGGNRQGPISQEVLKVSILEISLENALFELLLHIPGINELIMMCYIDRLWEESTVSHHSDVIMGTMASHITSPTIVYSTVYSGADQRKHQSSASLAFVRGILR